MRRDRLRLRVAAAWLGVLALGLDALVPIHLAFDVANAAAPARYREHHTGRDFVAALLTLATGHHDAGGAGGAPDKDRHHDVCAVCGAAATLAGFAPAAIPPLAAPAHLGAVVQAAPAAEAPHASPLAAYRSRAPPVS
jgi:hypothetical protein